MVATDFFRCDGEVALVTGAGTGLGAGFASALASAGARVALVGRRQEPLEAQAAAIEARGGRAPLVCRLDVAEAAAVPLALDAIEAAFGAPVSILVNNAGITGSGAPALDAEDWDAVIGINLSGAHRMAQACARRLVAAGRSGSVINIASILGMQTGKRVSAYATAKAGLLHMTRTLALEWAPHRIRVNAIAPGYALTELSAGFLGGDAGARMARRIPMRRLGESGDMLGALLLLASPRAGAFMTGSVIVVDGGQSLALA